MQQEPSSAKEAIRLEIEARMEELQQLQNAYRVLGGQIENGWPVAKSDQNARLSGMTDKLVELLAGEKEPLTSGAIAEKLFKEEYGLSAKVFRGRIQSLLNRAAERGNVQSKEIKGSAGQMPRKLYFTKPPKK